MTRFNVPAALAMTFRPVVVDPVKLILSMPGCSVSRGPNDSSPLSTWTTPGGKQAWASSTSLMFEYGVYGLRAYCEPVAVKIKDRRGGPLRGFDYDCIAGHHGRANLAARQQDWDCKGTHLRYYGGFLFPLLLLWDRVCAQGD